VAAAATTATLLGGATALTGPMSLTTGVPLAVGTDPDGYADLARGQPLNLTLGTSTQVSGFVVYSIET
jgi:hypothetical protein